MCTYILYIHTYMYAYICVYIQNLSTETGRASVLASSRMVAAPQGPGGLRGRALEPALAM